MTTRILSNGPDPRYVTRADANRRMCNLILKFNKESIDLLVLRDRILEARPRSMWMSGKTIDKIPLGGVFTNQENHTSDMAIFCVDWMENIDTAIETIKQVANDLRFVIHEAQVQQANLILIAPINITN